MTSKTDTVAILMADLHLRHTCPPARGNEENWYAAMERMLKQVRQLQGQYNCPVLCAGDVFDRHNPPPQLINWAIEHLPKKMIAIPGQHDLPYHSQVNLHESAFMTLVHAGVITKVGLGDMMFVTPLLRVHGFPFGEQVRPIAAKVDGTIDVALIHHYLWVMHHKYPGAPPESRASNWTKTLAGYDIAVFGDNHDGFTTRVGDCMVYNCGCLIQCKSDERHYKPSVGLLQDSGDIWRRYLDTSGNKWIDQPDEEKVDDDRLSSAIQELIGLDADSLDFREALRRTLDSMKDLRPGVKQVLMEIMEGQQ